MGTLDPRYNRYPDIDEIREQVGTEITVKRDIDEFTLGDSQAIHLTHRANTGNILEDGLTPGKLSSGSRHLAWTHGPKVTKQDDHLNDTLNHGQQILEEARFASDIGDPSLLPDSETSISLWPTQQLPQYLLSMETDEEPLPSCMPEFVDDERIPYVGVVIDAEGLEMAPYYGLPHTIKRRHMDQVAEALSPDGSFEDLSHEDTHLPVGYWNHCVISGSYELVTEEIQEYPLPEILVQSSEANELSDATHIPPATIDSLIVPGWTDDFDNLDAPDHLPSVPSGNHGFFMTR